MVKADNLRTLEIMATDEAGRWLPQGDFLGDDMEEPGAYNFGSTGCGTYDWRCVRKYFSPRKPVRSLRLFLCARGFDGRIVGRNLVGTVWFDDVRLWEHGIAAKRIPPGAIPVQPKAAPGLFGDVRVLDVDLGDRLWGKNFVTVTMAFRGRAAAERLRQTTLGATLTGPKGKSQRFTGATRILRAPAAGKAMGLAVATASYVVETLCTSWKQQYRVSLHLTPPGAERPVPLGDYAFGTPSKLLQAGAGGSYLYPDEPLVVYANLDVARGSFGDLARCRFVLHSGGKTKVLVELDDFRKILLPQTAPNYIDTRRLVQARLGSEGFTVHPWDEPVRDAAVTVELHGKGGLLAKSEPVRFGFLTRPPKPAFPGRIAKTAVNDKGFITVNGSVYFPVYWTPHFGICPEANYPPSRFGCKSVDLTQIVYSKKAMPDADVRTALLARIAEVRDDPKLFQYELGEGEMQLQGAGWKERAEWCKRAIGWIRQADPNHLISGPASWLVGHPGHNAAMRAFVGAWDVVGVEASFQTVPDVNRHAKPFMKPRRTAVLIGLETYFYQPNHVLRWRGYRGVLDGATGIGLCPSGMMQSRPDKVNYLRGLNGEFRGLAAVLAADEPKDRLSVSSKRVETMERMLAGRRYVIAVRGRDEAGPLTVRFAFPAGCRAGTVKVRFEGRSLPVSEKGFEDTFAHEQAVHVYELKP